MFSLPIRRNMIFQLTEAEERAKEYQGKRLFKGKLSIKTHPVLY